jgi:2-polyprenyl-3-methyl-5-hydroxy-6-metoxy-1,4-benzoquinol methylase
MDKRPAWETCLDIEAQDAAHYMDYVNRPLFDVIDGTPRRVLDLGCAAGALGAAIKERFAGAVVVGIEAGRAAAAQAATRLDRVVEARLDDIDFNAHGLEPGTFDAITASDVLEHLSNPWRLLERVRPLLAPGGQLLASIPNVRNAYLVSQLVLAGRWEYQERGLMDITHLRFFTLEEIRRMLEATGFRLEAYSFTISRMLADIYKANENREGATLQMGRLTIANVSAQELRELCAEQFLVRARLA